MIVLAGIVLIVLMALVPPWFQGPGHFETKEVSRSYPASAGGYGFIFRPPEGVSGIDTPRLFVQFFVVFVVAGGLCAVLKRDGK
jgi:hypothetical protein